MSGSIKVLIRADAGASIGAGHFARASSVANLLLDQGDAQVSLLTSIEGAKFAPAFFHPSTNLVALPEADCSAESALEIASQAGGVPDVILLDHYGSVQDWEALTERRKVKLVIFDDLDAAQGADIIVRPHGTSGEAGGKGIVLGGPCYLPLSPHIARLIEKRRRDHDKRLKLNICFGGSDPTRETEKALQALPLLHDQGVDIDVDVIIGPGAQVDPALEQSVSQLPHVTLYHAPSQERLAELMADADLALGAGGVMLWERLCLSVPSLIICVAENQRSQIESMVAEGAVLFLGHHDEVTPTLMADSIAALASDVAKRDGLAESGCRLVDGRGALRLAAWINALAMETRKVEIADAQDLLRWRTDEQNWQHNWEGQEKPSFEDHVVWLRDKLSNPACELFIVTKGGEPVGVVRFDLNEADASAYLSIYLVPAWHGRRIGLAVYFAAEHSLRKSHSKVNRIVSRIHSANAASARLHRDAGFEVEASKDREDWLDAQKALC